MRFCQAFMTELIRHIGKDTDVPAGDIGVGAREIGYLFGQHKRLTNRFTGVLTGKSLEYGGSLIRKRPQVMDVSFLLKKCLKIKGTLLRGRFTVSGSGNVAQYTTEKVIQLGGTVVTLSDSGGTVYDPNGITLEKLEFVKELKNERRGRIKEYAEKYGCTYLEGKTPWGVKCDVAFPSATQNELLLSDAKALVANGCIAVGEGANGTN